MNHLNGDEAMLTSEQIHHFRTFGFVVLRGLLGDRTAALRTEVDAALHDAYAATYDERVIDGISGHYLPMASAVTPVSASLVCDDARFIDAASDLLETTVVPECPEGVLYFEEAGWHNDDGIGVTGVKFAAYFEPLDGGNGALRLVPCSQLAEQSARLAAYRTHAASSPEFFPGHIAATEPGDVIAFDLHTWHASFNGRDRLAWTIVYLALPGDDRGLERLRRSATDSFEQAFRGFDRDRYPVWRDWLAQAGDYPRRAAVVDRMRRAGILDLAGADIGW